MIKEGDCWKTSDVAGVQDNHPGSGVRCAWYNDAHHHSGLSWLTSAVVHDGRTDQVVEVRHRLSATIFQDWDGAAWRADRILKADTNPPGAQHVRGDSQSTVRLRF